MMLLLLQNAQLLISNENVSEASAFFSRALIVIYLMLELVDLELQPVHPLRQMSGKFFQMRTIIWLRIPIVLLQEFLMVELLREQVH